jgi:hypothetical protein
MRPGTTCTVALPLEKCTQPEEDVVPPEDIRPIESAFRILIIDDIQMNRSMLKRRFQKAIAPNCVVVEATTGEEALKICENERFDVILVDHHMEEVRLFRPDFLFSSFCFSLTHRIVTFVVVGWRSNAWYRRRYRHETYED